MAASGAYSRPLQQESTDQELHLLQPRLELGKQLDGNPDAAASARELPFSLALADDPILPRLRDFIFLDFGGRRSQMSGVETASGQNG